MKNRVKGGKGDNKTPKEIAEKHKVTVSAINSQVLKGIKIEMEHTKDKRISKEIVMDHLWEIPDYYTRLARMEKQALKEETKLIIKDESPDTITVLAKYNGRNAGIMMIAPANAENTLEIVGIRFKEDYNTLFIINESVKSLWGIFPEVNSFIVAPKPQAIEFWNKLGFQRISKNYLISNRGH